MKRSVSFAWQENQEAACVAGYLQIRCFRWGVSETGHHLTMLTLVHKLLFLLSVASSPSHLLRERSGRLKGDGSVARLALVLIISIIEKKMFLFEC